MQLRRTARIRKCRSRLGVRPVARHCHHAAPGIGGCRNLDSARARGQVNHGNSDCGAVNVRVVRPADSVTVKALVPLEDTEYCTSFVRVPRFPSEPEITKTEEPATGTTALIVYSP